MEERISREHFYMGVARLVAERSTCPRAHVGAIIVKVKRIAATGYNGAPPHMKHCYEVGCEPSADGGCDRTVHAEANAIAYAARAGVSLEFAEMWCTNAPCYTCAKLILSTGILQVHYNIAYRDTRGIDLLRSQINVVAHDD